jgi:hypothetical protein
LLTGAIEVYANHSVIIIGSTDWPVLDWGDGPAGADGEHVAVRTRGQVAHVRVSFWSRTMPLVGTTVFDGDLDLNDYTICVGDIERLRRWTQRINQTGVQRVLVVVDDPGNASRVHVGLDLGADAMALPVPADTEPTLFTVLTSEPGALHPANERGLVLDGHDSPRARLATAITLLSEPDPSRPWLERYEIGLIVEWLRWLGIRTSFDEAVERGGRLLQLVRTTRDGQSIGNAPIPPDIADHIAATILDGI